MIKEQINKLSIKNKIIILMIPIIIVPITVFCILFHRSYENVIEEQSMKSVSDNQTMIADRLERILINMVDCSNYMSISINKIQANTRNILLWDVRTANSIYTELNLAQVIFSDVDTIVYVDAGNSLFSNNVHMLRCKQEWSDAVKLLEDSRGESVLLSKQDVESIGILNEEGKSDGMVVMGKKIIEITSGKTMGYLFVNVRMELFSAHLHSQMTKFYLLDQENNLLGRKKDFPSEMYGDINQEGFSIGWADRKKFLYSTYQMHNYNWKILGVTSLEKFNIGQERLVSIFLMVGIGMVFVEILLSFYFTNLITRPLVKLKQNTERVTTGDFSIRCGFQKKDEIGQLGLSFDAMAEKIQDLIQKVNDESRKKREYELALIQEQVKPHFLYNSLDMIIKLSEMKKYRESQRVAKKLADYYRNTLSDSQEVIRLERELLIVSDYMDLLQMRYYNLFEYHIKVREPDLKNRLVPKLILQPLIENAVYHGLKYKGEKGAIVISVETEDNRILIKIIDNGVGMPKQVLAAYQSGEKMDNHFGIYSVNHRVKLFYGESYGLSFEEVSEGTTAVLTLPL
ncbi:sensor histidine kinase [Robinsoniella sp. KNHs210]|uniref:sensor histidine kinase n=1 Tax=Robinsoniella sp. KNHs210 TaxID=1469950 RepID=UPI0004891ADE|nr:histidine kinase [Robinsoniella sp. KNHs210]